MATANHDCHTFLHQLTTHHHLLDHNAGIGPNNPRIANKRPEIPQKLQDGDHKEELFDAFHVPYFEEKRGVAKELDELFSTKLSSRINFI